jgi:alkylhydroperoxidase family enzyme
MGRARRLLCQARRFHAGARGRQRLGTKRRWSADEQALIALVDDLVDRRTIGEATWTALSAHFDEAQILEAIALVGYYHTISFLCRGLELPLENYGARFPAKA